MNKELHKTSIGGQALIEGVMMRGVEKSAMAVRLPSSEIDVETWENTAINKWYKKTPFIRGVFNFIDMIMLGYKCLMKSAEKVDFEEENPSKFDVWIEKTLGDKMFKVIQVLTMIFGIGIAVLLFMVLPALISMFLGSIFPELPKSAMSIIEGVSKFVVFIAYLLLVTRMEEIRRVFAYHGAEHKTIACYEAGEELTVENARKHTRFHPRCGTSFILIVIILSIVIFSVITWENVLIRSALKILMLPIVICFAYEVIKLAGRYDNIFTKIISYPGLWLQRLTTYEPDDSQLEVAIAAMKPVLPQSKGEDKW